jgi:hypothetical protein
MNMQSTFVFYWDEQDSLKHPSLLQFTHTQQEDSLVGVTNQFCNKEVSVKN